MKLYASIDDLPEDLRDALPRRACELYRAVYNRVVENETRAGRSVRSEVHVTAHDAALWVVTAEFRQDRAGRWLYDPLGDEEIAPRARKNRKT